MSAQPRIAPLRMALVDERGRRDQLVYDRLKERLLTCPPPLGGALEARSLADELGVSTTPVREALTRLAAERLLVAARHRGFFVKVPSEPDIRGLYCANQAVLGAALGHWPMQICDASSEARVTPARTAEALARAAGELFLQIATRSGIDELGHIVSNISDRLYRVRIVEFALIEGMREELAKIAAAAAQRRRDDLQTLLRRYHERREALAASLCEQLVVESYFPVRRRFEST
jgi:DNA-binding GntR family transcriptional regulator